MSIFKENDISLDTFLEQEQIQQARGGDVPLGEYFIDVALQRGDRSFTDFEKFTTNYKNFSKAYITDVENKSSRRYK